MDAPDKPALGVNVVEWGVHHLRGFHVRLGGEQADHAHRIHDIRVESLVRRRLLVETAAAFTTE